LWRRQRRRPTRQTRAIVKITLSKSRFAPTDFVVPAVQVRQWRRGSAAYVHRLYILPTEADDPVLILIKGSNWKTPDLVHQLPYKNVTVGRHVVQTIFENSVKKMTTSRQTVRTVVRVRKKRGVINLILVMSFRSAANPCPLFPGESGQLVDSRSDPFWSEKSLSPFPREKGTTGRQTVRKNRRYTGPHRTGPKRTEPPF
jgi:hypothetical protein